MAGGAVEPEGSIRGVAGGEDGGAVLERDAEELGFAASGQDDLVTEGAGELAARRGADVIGGMIADDSYRSSSTEETGWWVERSRSHHWLSEMPWPSV